MGLFCKPTQEELFGRVQKMGGVGLEPPRKLLPRACTDADTGELPLAGQELRAARLSPDGVVSLGFLDTKHQQGFVFYLLCSDKLFQNKVLTIMFKKKKKRKRERRRESRSDSHNGNY